jgi:hypothetical protein
MEIPDIELLRADLEVRWAVTKGARPGIPPSRWIGLTIGGLEANQAQLLRRWIQEHQARFALSKRLDAVLI